MIPVTEALAEVVASAHPLGSEQVHLGSARGRVLAIPVRSGRDVPPFRNSAMDGFAFRHGDLTTTGTSEFSLVGTVAAGDPGEIAIPPRCAVAIMTGAVVPDDADTVVRLEDCHRREDSVVIEVAPTLGANIRHPGEDVRRGDLVLDEGRTLQAADVGVAASVGRAVLSVYRRPVVAILSTGAELVDLGQEPGPGQIANSNAYSLAAAVEEAGGIPRVLGTVTDTEEATRAAFASALDADMVLSTGGVSMGSFDIVRQVLAGLGVEERFWKVAQKPGKPLSFGLRGSVPVFGLPGNPVSALVCFYLYARPRLRIMGGHRDPYVPRVHARAAVDFTTSAKLTEFVRVSLTENEDGLVAHPTGTQSSGVLRSMSLCDGLAVSPAGVDAFAAGDPVEVIVLREGQNAAQPPFVLG